MLWTLLSVIKLIDFLFPVYCRSLCGGGRVDECRVLSLLLTSTTVNIGCTIESQHLTQSSRCFLNVGAITYNHLIVRHGADNALIDNHLPMYHPQHQGELLLTTVHYLRMCQLNSGGMSKVKQSFLPYKVNVNKTKES